jgi:hypothetical protein
MPLFLWFYLAGLSLALGVGIVCYFVIGQHAAALFERLFDPRAGYLWGRSFRLLLVATAVIGGLATQWYGCDYTDYERVARDKRIMLEKTTEQVSGALQYAVWFLVLAAAVTAVTYAVLAVGRDRLRADTPDVEEEPGSGDAGPS